MQIFKLVYMHIAFYGLMDFSDKIFFTTFLALIFQLLAMSGWFWFSWR